MSKKVIAIIPARSGSKSIRNKNIMKFLNKPLIAWSIEQSLKSKLIDEVYLSTDSKKYANIARIYGLKNIIMRPKNISSDTSPDIEFILHAIKQIKNDYEFIAHLRPTTPLRDIKMIDKIIAYFKKNHKKYSSLRTVHEEPETSYKSFEIKKKQLKPLKNLKLNIDQLNSPRQVLNNTYSANGVLDLYKKIHVIKKKKLFGNKVLSYITPYTPELDTKEQINLLKIYAKNKNIK